MMTNTTRSRLSTLLPGAVVLVVLLLFAYLPVLQRIPNGSEHTTMIDVGETQIVLNVWGTLHPTGYPLYVMLSSAVVAVLKVVGVDAATAPAVASLLWGMLGLVLIYALMVRISGQPMTAGAVTLLFGLTRFEWLHMEIAEVYSFGVLLLAALLLIALWHPERTEYSAEISRPILYALALIGGIAIGHHRAIAMAVPAVLYAALPMLRAQGKALPRVLLICLLLGLIGLLPYAYIAARAQAGAGWVYGEPETLQGLVDQFMAREYGRYIGGVHSLDSLIANFSMVSNVIITNLTWIGVAGGIIGLVVGVMRKSRRRAAITLILSGAAVYLFHVFVYTDVLAALILGAELSLAFGWLFIAEKLFEPFDFGSLPVFSTELTLIGLAGLAAFGLITLHRDWIGGLTSDPGAQEAIHLLESTPQNGTLMIAWGPRHYAAGFAHDVLGLRPDVTLLDHKGDFRAALDADQLYTPDYTFYTLPISWWESEIGQPVHLSGWAPHLVRIRRTAPIAGIPDDGTLPTLGVAQLDCHDPVWSLSVVWIAPNAPIDRDYNVFVHVLDENGVMIGQSDESAPVYGWYPFSRWRPAEIVRDTYPLPTLEHTTGVRVHFGLYYQEASGAFVNVVEDSLAFPSYCVP
ncbi:MAG: DUF2723 domain-containing protein [Anaerolineae bacterium]